LISFSHDCPYCGTKKSGFEVKRYYENKKFVDYSVFSLLATCNTCGNPIVGAFDVYDNSFNKGEIARVSSLLQSSNQYNLTELIGVKYVEFYPNERKTAEILLYCTLFNLIGALIAGWGFAHSAAYANLTHDSFISGVVEMKLARSNELVLLEGILANIFVNIAILSFVLVKDGGAKLWLVLSAIYMFVFLTNEHIAANFASFAIVKFSVAADSIANFDIPNILRHWGVTFVGNFIGGGLLMGLPYAFLNKNEDTYVD